MKFHYKYSRADPPTPHPFRAYITTYDPNPSSRTLEHHAVFNYARGNLSWELHIGRWGAAWLPILMLVVLIAIVGTIGVLFTRLKKLSSRSGDSNQSSERNNEKPSTTQSSDSKTPEAKADAPNPATTPSTPTRYPWLSRAWKLLVLVLKPLITYLPYLQPISYTVMATQHSIRLRSIAVGTANTFPEPVTNEDIKEKDWQPELAESLWLWPPLEVTCGIGLVVLALSLTRKHVSWARRTLNSAVVLGSIASLIILAWTLRTTGLKRGTIHLHFYESFIMWGVILNTGDWVYQKVFEERKLDWLYQKIVVERRSNTGVGKAAKED